MTAEKQQTISPARQMLAAQVGTVFNAAHEYLRNLEPTGDDGNPVSTKQLEFAHCRIDEAAMWAIKSVLTFGGPKPKPSPAEHVAAANEGVPASTVEAAPLTPENTAMPDVAIDPLAAGVDKIEKLGETAALDSLKPPYEPDTAEAEHRREIGADSATND